jgi:hypothetical protein
MRHDVRKLEVPATGNHGAAKAIQDLSSTAVAIDGTGAAAFSLAVQVKISGADDAANDGWLTVATGIIATAIVPLAASANGAPYPATHVRLVSTTTGSPAPKAVVGGYNERTT